VQKLQSPLTTKGEERKKGTFVVVWAIIPVVGSSERISPASWQVPSL